MAKKKEVGAPVEVEVKDTEVEASKPAKVSKKEVVVRYRDHRGEPIERTFSQEVHGENFAELADEFKATNASRILE